MGFLLRFNGQYRIKIKYLPVCAHKRAFHKEEHRRSHHRDRDDPKRDGHGVVRVQEPEFRRVGVGNGITVLDGGMGVDLGLKILQLSH